MASATNLKPSQTVLGDAAESYGTRDNITVPGADQTDAAVNASGAIATAAAARATDRPGPFAPDAADYVPIGSERSAP
jgi:hypothetical protein